MKRYKAALREGVPKSHEERYITFCAKDFDHATNIARLALCDNERVTKIEEKAE